MEKTENFPLFSNGEGRKEKERFKNVSI